MRLERVLHVAEEGFEATALTDRENAGSPLPIITSPARILLTDGGAIASRFVKFGRRILFARASIYLGGLCLWLGGC